MVLESSCSDSMLLEGCAMAVCRQNVGPLFQANEYDVVLMGSKVWASWLVDEPREGAIDVL